MIIIFTTEMKSLNELECCARLFYSLSTVLSQCRAFGMAGSVVYGATATCCWFKFTLYDTEWRVSTSVTLRHPYESPLLLKPKWKWITSEIRPASLSVHLSRLTGRRSTSSCTSGRSCTTSTGEQSKKSQTMSGTRPGETGLDTTGFSEQLGLHHKVVGGRPISTRRLVLTQPGTCAARASYCARAPEEVVERYSG
jgi:hypothetical protein